MSVNSDYRSLITEPVVPQPVTTSYWRTFKVTSKVVLSYVPGLVSLGLSASFWNQIANPPPCSPHHNCHGEENDIFLKAYITLVLGIGFAAEATTTSSISIKKHMEKIRVNTPEGIQLLRERLQGSNTPNDFFANYGSKLPALVEMKIFTQNDCEQIKFLKDRYDQLVNNRGDLNKILDPDARSQRSKELDVKEDNILAEWQLFKEKYLPQLTV